MYSRWICKWEFLKNNQTIKYRINSNYESSSVKVMHPALFHGEALSGCSDFWGNLAGPSNDKWESRNRDHEKRFIVRAVWANETKANCCWESLQVNSCILSGGDWRFFICTFKNAVIALRSFPLDPCKVRHAVAWALAVTTWRGKALEPWNSQFVYKCK